MRGKTLYVKGEVFGRSFDNLGGRKFYDYVLEGGGGRFSERV